VCLICDRMPSYDGKQPIVAWFDILEETWTIEVHQEITRPVPESATYIIEIPKSV
jgi:hypothetical protein